MKTYEPNERKRDEIMEDEAEGGGKKKQNDEILCSKNRQTESGSDVSKRVLGDEKAGIFNLPQHCME